MLPVLLTLTTEVECESFKRKKEIEKERKKTEKTGKEQNGIP